MGTDRAASFRETQRFPLWIFLIPLAIEVVVAALIATKDWRLVPLVLAPGVLVVGVWWLLRLETRVDENGLYVRLYPLPGRTIRLEEIVQAGVRTYRPLMDYGGWGVRWSPGEGKAYNARGNRGVQLVLQGESRVLIGSQRPEELLAALKQIMGEGEEGPQR
jgi:Protein of unknown function (DUF3093)